jgi:hypothetical protein
MLTPLDFDPKFDFFKKSLKTCITNHYVSPIKNTGFTAKKYRVSVNFCFKLVFFGKTDD